MKTKLLFWVFGLLMGTQIISAQVPSYVPSSGLQAWYPFSGNANDLGGANLNGTVNGALLTTDRNGNANAAYSFTTNQQINIPNTAGKNSYPLTISLWYNASALNNGEASNIFSKYVASSWNGYQIGLFDCRAISNSGTTVNDGFGTQAWYTRSANNKVIGYYNEPPFLQKNISANVWYHYVFVLDASGGKIYVNGQLIDSHSWTGTPGVCTNSYLWKVGGQYGTQSWFNGKIDDIGIWNRALSTNEIQQLYTTACSATVPSGSASQTLCSGATVTNLSATGTNILWYATSTGGTALTSTTALVNGTTYYASQTVSGCESNTRLAVTVSLNNPTVSTSSTTICGGTNVTLTANSNLTTTQIQTQVNNLVNSGLWNLLVTYNGHYYLKYQSTMTWPQAKVLCEQNGGYMYCVNSQSENDNVSIPIANSQAYGNFFLGLYQDTSDAIYSEPTGGWKWLDGTPLSYANWGQNEPNDNGGSENFSIMDWNNTGALWNDITNVVNGTVIMEYPGITTYLWSTGETSQTISPTPNQTTQYWVDVTSNGVTCRKYIAINVNSTTSAPTGSTTQTLCSGSTVANLTATGTAIKWYSSATGGTALASTTALVNGTTYYASQTISGCESTSRLAVTVTLNNPSVTASAATVCAGTPVSLVASDLNNNQQINNKVAEFSNDVSNKIDLSYNTQQVPTGTFSYDFWFNTSRTITLLPERTGGGSLYGGYNGQNYAVIPGYQTQTSYRRGTGVSVGTNGISVMEHCEYFIDSRFTYTAALTGWHHCAVVYQDSSLSLYVDGNLIGTRANGSNFGGKGTQYATIALVQTIGAGYPGQDPNDNYTGKLDEYRQWSVALSASQIAQIYARKLQSDNMAECNLNLTFDDSNVVNRSIKNASLSLINTTAPNFSSDNSFLTGGFTGASIANITTSNTTGASPTAYLWSTGATTASINVTPTSTTNYWVDVTTNGVTCRKNITINVNSTTAAPTGTPSQIHCSGSSIANLSVTGTNIQWYAASSGGAPLASSTALVNGTTYYASQTVNGCESTSRLAVTIALNNPSVTTSATTVCAGTPVSLVASDLNNNQQINNKVAEFSNNASNSIDLTYNVQQVPSDTFSYDFWFNTSRTITLLPERTGGGSLYGGYNGQNYAVIPSYQMQPSYRRGTGVSVGTNGISVMEHCEYFIDSRLTYTAALTGWHHCAVVYQDSSVSLYVDGNLIGTRANGNNFGGKGTQYARVALQQTIGAGYPGQDPNDNYTGKLDEYRQWTVALTASQVAQIYARKLQSDNMAECNLNLTFDDNSVSNKSMKSSGLTLGNNTLPTFSSDNSFLIGGFTGASITNTTNVNFSGTSPSTYSWSTGATTASINVTPTSTSNYWVDVTTNGIACRKNISIAVASSTLAPTGANNQTLVQGSTLVHLVVSGQNVQWYAASSGGSPLPDGTVLVNGATYYASQTVNGCESRYRLPVIVEITGLSNSEFNSLSISYSPNPVDGILNIKASTTLSNVKVCNVLGQTLVEKTSNNEEVELNLSMLPSGTYFVRVESAAKQETFKIVKK